MTGVLGGWPFALAVAQVLAGVLVPHGACPRDRGGPLVACRAVRAGPPLVCFQAAAAPRAICVTVADEVQEKPESSQWIGVRLTPIPAPLAAHVGSQGLMIANVVKDSPADRAGVQRYDVVVEFDGRKIDDDRDLIEAIGAVKPGQAADMVVIRRAEKVKLKVTPEPRPQAGKWEYKYDEPPEDVIEQSLRLRGHRLMPGPGGSWWFEDLGPLRSLPDLLKEFEIFKDWPGPVDVEEEDEPGAEDLDRDQPDVQTRIEVRVEVDDRGNTVTIVRDASGRITVKRVDADGKESSAIYETEREFREKDPQAFRLYRRSGAGGWGTGSLRYMRPRLEDLSRLRERFQVEIEEKLRKALERAREAQEQAEKAAEELRKMKIEIRRQDQSGQKSTVIEKAQKLAVRVEDGRVSVTVDEGSGPVTYEFQSTDEFRQKRPDLYERCKALFE